MHKPTQRNPASGTWGTNHRITFRFHSVRTQWGQAAHEGFRVIPELAMPSVVSTVPQGLDTVGRADIPSGAKQMHLTRLETRLQCGSKVYPGERVGSWAEQGMMHVPGSIREMSYSQKSVQGDGTGARHTYNITEAGTGGPRLSWYGHLGPRVGLGCPRGGWAGTVSPSGRLKSWTDSH